LETAPLVLGQIEDETSSGVQVNAPQGLIYDFRAARSRDPRLPRSRRGVAAQGWRNTMSANMTSCDRSSRVEGGDFDSAEWAHPELEWVVVDGPTPGSCVAQRRGESLRDFLSAFRLSASKRRVPRARRERVLVLVRYSGRGKSSGLELGQMQRPRQPVPGPRREGYQVPHYWNRELRSPTSGCSETVDGLDERGLRALDLRGLGARRLQLDEQAHPELEFVIADGPSPADGWGQRGWQRAGRLAGMLGGVPRRGGGVPRARRRARARARQPHWARKASGLELGQMRTKGAVLFHIRDGKVIRHVVYLDRDRADLASLRRRLAEVSADV